MSDPVPLPLRRPSAHHDSLTPGQRRGVIGAITLAHVAAIWGVLQVPAVREAVVEAAPIFVDLLAPPAPPVPPPPPPPPMPQIQKPQPKVVIAAAPSPAPAVFEVEVPPEIPQPPAPEPVPVVAAPAPPAPPPPPRIIPASAIQYLVPPSPEYPLLSRRAQEKGRVLIDVYIDETGTPRSVRLKQSSGFARLDAAAQAAILKARFRPPTVNGVAVAGWGAVPIDFDLER